MARRRGLKVEDLPGHLQGEARRQLEGGGVDLASMAVAQLALADRDMKPENVLIDRDLKPENALERETKPHKMPRPPRTKSKTERDYENHLTILQAAGEVVSFAYEPLRLVLAPKLTWCPDFAVLRVCCAQGVPGRVQLVEVKPRKRDGRAFWTEDSRIKVKAAAQQHGVLFEVIAVWPNGDGGWNREDFHARPD